jgi:hypothetical protein
VGNELGAKVAAANGSGASLFEVWKQYEVIAMHFNELIMQLRIQALAGVAAISTFAGILGKSGEGQRANWGLLTGVFFFLCIFWVAIWVLDFRYYTRLLLGAVDALLQLEKLSLSQVSVTEINMSTLIEAAVDGSKYAGASKNERERRARLALGRKWFYGLVFSALVLGLVFSTYQLCR